MREFKLRNLETGDVVVRNGADTKEILRNCRPGRKLIGKNGKPLKNPHPGFVLLGKEPDGWTDPNAERHAEEAEVQAQIDAATDAVEDDGDEAEETEFEE